jgi:hypothetical protein
MPAQPYIVKKDEVLTDVPGDVSPEFVRVYLHEEVCAISPGHAAQIRDLLRCVAWIRDIQINDEPENFDLREIFGDLKRAYCVDQLAAARRLYAQLNAYCEANDIPPTRWKME